MRPLTHLVLGIFFALFCLAIFPTIGFQGFFIIIFSTVLIDADHYLFHVFKKRNFSLFKAYKDNIKFIEKMDALPRGGMSKYKYYLLAFHGIEFWAILFFLMLKDFLFVYVFAGVMFHMVLDWIALFYYKHPKDCKISQVYNALRNKGKKDLL